MGYCLILNVVLKRIFLFWGRTDAKFNLKVII